ncbi:hypothetical protein HY250_02965 [Candidatus Azambacteria bacterium]|nr:hypothetical protein [Candidatus Azambacteria bacterium]
MFVSLSHIIPSILKKRGIQKKTVLLTKKEGAKRAVRAPKREYSPKR